MDPADDPTGHSEAENSPQVERPLTPDKDGPIRNPSPPPDDVLSGVDKSLLEADTISNTVFSKHWVFSILMKLLKQVEDEQEKKDDQGDAAQVHGIDIDEELENDLCRLWDMSANVEVSKFLHEWKSPDIFLSVISKTNAPRITEICMGVLGNMACSPAIRQDFSKKQQLIDLSFALLSGSDSPTMVETSRLIYTCLNDEECAPAWLETVKKDEEILKSIIFILHSSTNCDLIHNVADLLDQLLDLDDSLLQSWSGPALIQAISEALNQVSRDKPNTVSLLLHSLQVISTTSSGIDSLVEVSEKIMPLLTGFISGVFEDRVLAMRGRENTLASVVSVLSTMVLQSQDAVKSLAQKESRTVKQLAEMLYVTHHKRSSREDSSYRRRHSSSNESTDRRRSSSRSEGQEGEGEERTGKTENEEQKEEKGGGGGGWEGGKREEEEEEDPEAVWLTELLKEHLVEFFCCALEVSKKNTAFGEKLHSCGGVRLEAVRECLPTDRNDLSEAMELIQAKK
ncbi:LOW QUALITY PROTEIN: protein saal1-like [Diadema setosum]|uniref:LOW QUALITY PROTEIN: protein saal1-like n=1 Tax=Diadema setosum TaxID=31175 RepID=UPI003B3B82C7